jgi:hypothetical protein
VQREDRTGNHQGGGVRRSHWSEERRVGSGDGGRETDERMVWRRDAW